ncbi:MAG: tetratricopeptide repeat protein [Firmicutes bacterium]|nr:tetratricopeptide repeat protein [Bacillota bacterium]
MTKDKAVTETKYIPRPITPEDESYRDVMMLFTNHPVQPKYWFEDFGDYWSCSCGQINRGDTCSNCGLERELLRKLFILHKPGESPDEGGPDGERAEAGVAFAQGGDGTSEDTPSEEAPDRAAGKKKEDAPCGADDEPEPEEDGEPDADAVRAAEEADLRSRRRKTKRIMIILIVLLLLLGGGLAFFYYYALPEYHRQHDLRTNAAKDVLSHSLPAALEPLDDIRFDAWVRAGDAEYNNRKYEKAIEYYQKALDLHADSNVQQKILTAKFGYVTANMNKDSEEQGEHFEDYLNELHKKKYPGIQDIYRRHFSWKASILVNDDLEDESNDEETLDLADPIYFHSTITGGPPDDSVALYYEIVWPDGTSERNNVPSSRGSGETVTTRCAYTAPANAQEGRLTFKLFNSSTHEMLGTDSVWLE